MRDTSEVRLQAQAPPAAGEELTVKLKAQPTDTGFEIVPIDAGTAKGWGYDFSTEVLKSSLPLWEGIPCFLDHEYSGNQSVMKLAGALHNPKWSDKEQGITATLVPNGPRAEDLQRLRLAAKTDPAIAAAIGFSAHLFIQQTNNTVMQISKVISIDCVTDPARGGRFLSAYQPQGARMKVAIRRNGVLMEVEESEVLPTDERVMLSAPAAGQQATQVDTEAEIAALMQAQTAKNQAENRNNTAVESMRQTRLKTCRDLLKVSLQASNLPAPTQERIKLRFEKQLATGTPFEPAELEVAVVEEQNYLSAMTAAGAIQGPGRVSNMATSADQLEKAVDQLFGIESEARLANVTAQPLRDLKELYLMLTGDWDLHGGYYGERIQLATTADFTGLVKNALNKIVDQQWDALGKAGYNWWEKIVKVEHFTSLNTITGVLMGTVGTLQTVEEGAEYTQLIVGDSPETADWVKKGGYIPMTLELIDRGADATRVLKAYATELANAGLRNISALVAAVFTSNSGIGPTMADTGALFNATAPTTAGGHLNLLTTALAAAQWDVVSAAVFNQPMLIKNESGYYGVGPKMAINPRYLLVPRALQLTAMKIIYPTLENAATIYSENQQRGQPGDVVVVPEFTDATDFAAVCDPVVAPSIILGERFGIKPEIFTAGRETDPAVFMNDEHRIKIRMFNALLVQDYRALHKSNVAG
jgi:hypothetical protein